MLLLGFGSPSSSFHSWTIIMQYHTSSFLKQSCWTKPNIPQPAKPLGFTCRSVNIMLSTWGCLGWNYFEEPRCISYEVLWKEILGSWKHNIWTFWLLGWRCEKNLEWETKSQTSETTMTKISMHLQFGVVTSNRSRNVVLKKKGGLLQYGSTPLRWFLGEKVKYSKVLVIHYADRWLHFQCFTRTGLRPLQRPWLDFSDQILLKTHLVYETSQT